MPEARPGAFEARTPSAVGLTRLSTRMAFPAGGEALYRFVLRSANLTPDSEFLLVPSGRGKSARFVAEVTGAAGAGVDPDPQMVAVASERAKAKGLASRLHFERAELDDLPYQDGVFDLVLAEIDLAAAPDPGAAVREMVRVAKLGGSVVLIQLVWLRAPEPERRADLVRKLGIQPRMAVEWKQLLRENGVTDIQVEDGWDRAGAPRSWQALAGLSQLFTLEGKLRILPRAWRRWGWVGVRSVLTQERELRRLLGEDRVLAMALIRGRVARAVDGVEPQPPSGPHVD